jgi:ABC-type Zn uptake system ZnuABC Zn-binding protein ZnuA
VGGERAEVVQLLKPNTDPHDYEPRPADVLATADATSSCSTATSLDHWMGQVVERAGGDAAIVDLGARRCAGEQGPRRALDPHWWHDPRNARGAVVAIRDALTKANPAPRGVYARNAAAYLARLRALDRGIAACIGACAPAARKLVTDHDAFGYFARPLRRSRSSARSSPRRRTQASRRPATSRLTALIRRERVQAVFPESSINAKLAQAIARQTGATSDYTLYGDTLGPEGLAAAPPT